MAKKKTHLDKVIEQLDGEIAVLQAAKERLLRQQPKRLIDTGADRVPPLRRAQAKTLIEGRPGQTIVVTGTE